jgi:hypothetical protein
MAAQLIKFPNRSAAATALRLTALRSSILSAAMEIANIASDAGEPIEPWYTDALTLVGAVVVGDAPNQLATLIAKLAERGALPDEEPTLIYVEGE